MSHGLTRGELTARTCEMYSVAINAGEEPSMVVGELASMYGVNRPAIWRRLRAGGVLPRYKTGHRVRSKRHRTPTECEAARLDLPRVDRDPCPRCGVRRDLGCEHNRAPVGMVFG
jgi:hypothetical protein